MSARWRSSDGRWDVEIVTLTNTPPRRPEGGQGYLSAGDGQFCRVKEYGFYTGRADDDIQLRAMLGEDVYANLQPVPTREAR